MTYDPEEIVSLSFGGPRTLRTVARLVASGELHPYHTVFRDNGPPFEMTLDFARELMSRPEFRNG